MLIIFEDLHWADATSLRLFAFLAAEIDDSGLLVIGTTATAELSRQHPLFDTLAELARSPVFHRIELGRLSSRREPRSSCAAASGGAANANLVSAIHARTEGHPLFLEETLRFMTEGRAYRYGAASSDDPRADGDPDRCARSHRQAPEPAVEPCRQAVVDRRLYRPDLRSDVLAQLESDKSEDEVLVALEEALAVHLIETVPETQQFRFGHALIRETLYDEMMGPRRANCTCASASFWSSVMVPTTRRCCRNWRITSAKPDPRAAVKALGYAEVSAERAVKVLAFEEAARLYRLALHLQEQHFDRDAGRRCALLLSLGEVELALGAGEPARAVYGEAAELARCHSLAGLFAQAAVGFERSAMLAARSGEPAVVLLLEAIALHQNDDPMRVELLARLCRAYIYCNRAAEAKASHRRAVTLARQIGDSSGLYLALASITASSYWPDMLNERLVAANEALDIAKDRSLALPIVELLPFFLADLIRIGDGPALRGLLDEGRRRADETRAPYLQTLCRHTAALVAINEGRFAEAEALAAQALESGRRLAEDQALSAFGMQMFCLRREQGRLREALPMLQHFVRTTPKDRTWQPGWPC